MVPLTRRKCITLVASSPMIFLFGCLDRFRPAPSSQLVVAYIHEVPDEAEVVPSTDERIADIEAIEEVLEMAHEYVEDHISEGNNPEDLHRRLSIGFADARPDYHQIKRSLEQLPYPDGASGYIEYRGRVYWVALEVRE